MEEDEYFSGKKGVEDWGGGMSDTDYQYVRIEYILSNDSIQSKKITPVYYFKEKCNRTQGDLNKMADSFREGEYTNICEGKLRGNVPICTFSFSGASKNSKSTNYF